MSYNDEKAPLWEMLLCGGLLGLLWWTLVVLAIRAIA